MTSDNMALDTASPEPVSPADCAVHAAMKTLERHGSSGRNVLWLHVPGTEFRRSAEKVLGEIDSFDVFGDEFHAAAERILAHTPLVKKDPHAFRRGRSMERTWEDFRRMLESKGLDPHLVQPFIFQTSGGQGKEDFAENSLFWFFQYHEDALLEIAFRGGGCSEVHFHGRFFPVQQIYENPKDHPGLERVVCCMLDLEVPMSALGDERGEPRVGRDDVTKAMKRVPYQLARDMHRLGLVAEGTPVSFVVKDKSRPIGEDGKDYKVSFHVKVEIAGSRLQHMHAVGLLLKQHW